MRRLAAIFGALASLIGFSRPSLTAPIPKKLLPVDPVPSRRMRFRSRAHHSLTPAAEYRRRKAAWNRNRKWVGKKGSQAVHSARRWAGLHALFSISSSINGV